MVPDEALLLELARRGLTGQEGWIDEGPMVDGEEVYVVGVLLHRARPPEALPADVRAASGGDTRAIRAGTSGVLYPYRGQRDGTPIYEPPTPAGAHDSTGPKTV